MKNEVEVGAGGEKRLLLQKWWTWRITYRDRGMGHTNLHLLLSSQMTSMTCVVAIISWPCLSPAHLLLPTLYYDGHLHLKASIFRDFINHFHKYCHLHDGHYFEHYLIYFEGIRTSSTIWLGDCCWWRELSSSTIIQMIPSSGSGWGGMYSTIYWRCNLFFFSSVKKQDILARVWGAWKKKFLDSKVISRGKAFYFPGFAKECSTDLLFFFLAISVGELQFDSSSCKGRWTSSLLLDLVEEF